MRRRTGLTLIELMLALALTGVLSAAILRAVTGLARDPALRAPVGEEVLLAGRLRELLTGDVASAGSWRATEAGFALRTNVSLDARTLRVAHLPAEVRYEVRRIAGHNWLVRVQECPYQPAFAELACRGVRSVRMVLPGRGKGPSAPGAWKPMGEAATVRIEFEDGRDPLQLTIQCGVIE